MTSAATVSLSTCWLLFSLTRDFFSIFPLIGLYVDKILDLCRGILVGSKKKQAFQQRNHMNILIELKVASKAITTPRCIPRLLSSENTVAIVTAVISLTSSKSKYYLCPKGAPVFPTVQHPHLLDGVLSRKSWSDRAQQKGNLIFYLTVEIHFFPASCFDSAHVLCYFTGFT